jgi:hypothetical protein
MGHNKMFDCLVPCGVNENKTQVLDNLELIFNSGIQFVGGRFKRLGNGAVVTVNLERHFL